MGADFEIGCVRNAEWEPQADITVRGSRLRGVEIGGQSIPNLIDEIPIICVAAAYAQGVTRVRDAAELRVKESDRIESTAAMLRATGIEVLDFADGLAVMGRGGQPSGGEVDSFGDHRLAMAGAFLALGATAPVAVRDVECVGASYPGFFADLQRLLQ
jgi:3-phosphoshikimate 1-carboxyvinyltransferase